MRLKPESRNPEFSGCSVRTRRGQTSINLLVILGTFLIVAALVWVMQYYTRPAPVNELRILERKKFLAEIRATEADALNNYGWVDPGKGLVRLPISRATDLVLEEWKNPAAAHSNLAARAEKAYALPPAAPAAPNPFE
jgi:hypothetical protein